MTESTVAVLALVLLGWSIVSAALARHNVTGPLVLVTAGYVLANPFWGLLSVDVEAASVQMLAELTLALVLFSDASRVRVRQLQHDVWLPVRLLGVGLPLSMILGGLLAAWLIGDLTWALAGFVGAALAPTDAALSVQVIEDGRIPMRLRRALNVESGLNDGIATPIVAFMLAVAASQIMLTTNSAGFEAGSALIELAGGLVVGVGLGFVGGFLTTFAARRAWITAGGRGLTTTATAVASYTVAVAFGANGFVAAFVAGLVLGAALDHAVVDLEEAGQLTELGGELLALVVWFLFGAGIVPVVVELLAPSMVVYAVASLTLVRMLPVAFSLLRSGLDRPSVVFVGWFGPRGLASVVFTLLAVEQLGDTSSPLVEQAVAAVALTVLLSVVLHGITAGPGGRRYVQREQAGADGGEGPPARRPFSS